MSGREIKSRRSSSGKCEISTDGNWIVKRAKNPRDIERELDGYQILRSVLGDALPRLERLDQYRIKIEKGIPIEQIAPIDGTNVILQIAKVLDNLHNHKIVHGDPGRGNILYLPRTSGYSLIDFETASLGCEREIFKEENGFLDDMMQMFPHLKDRLKAAQALITRWVPTTRMFLGKVRSRIIKERRGNDPLACVLEKVLTKS